VRFSLEELHFIFSGIKRVVKPQGFNFFSVRNQNDNLVQASKLRKEFMTSMASKSDSSQKRRYKI